MTTSMMLVTLPPDLLAATITFAWGLGALVLLEFLRGSARGTDSAGSEPSAEPKQDTVRKAA